MTEESTGDGIAASVEAAAEPVSVPATMIEPARALAEAVHPAPPAVPPPGPIAVAVSPAPAPAPATAQQVVVTHRKQGPGFVSRALWYILVGWWLTGIAITFAWLCALSIILLPIAYMVVNKIPTILTLRPRSIETNVHVTDEGHVHITTGGAAQRMFWQRAVWFILVGWWACGVAMLFAYLCCLSIILFPIGLMTFNRVPAVLTLQRN